jgi:hypothetical protein
MTSAPNDHHPCRIRVRPSRHDHSLPVGHSQMAHRLAIKHLRVTFDTAITTRTLLGPARRNPPAYDQSIPTKATT